MFLKCTMLKIIKSILLAGSFFLLAASASAAKDANDYLKKASQSYNQEDYREAEKAFRQLLKMKVSLHGDFYYFYGKTLYHNGKYKKAAQNLSTFTTTVGNKSKYYSDARRVLMRTEKKLAELKLAERGTAKPDKKKQVGKHSRIPEMVKIPAGSFIMGAIHGLADQKPPHKMTLKNDFAMGKYEVTFAQYDAFAKAAKKKRPDDLGWGRGNRPVINVSLQNAKDYAVWLSKKNNRTFRLPTESEWEYVARTGFKRQFGFNDLTGLGDANCDGCRYFWESAKTIEVGSFESNKYGIHDLFGNVWEWTCSMYTPGGYNGAEKFCVDKNDLDGKTIAVRGGGWNTFSETLRSYIRYNNFPTYAGSELGFRLVEELD